MVESKCIVCGAKIVSQRKRKYCDACKKDRSWDWKKEGEIQKAKREKETELADLHSTMALSAKIAVATGLSYGRQVLLAQQQKKDLRAFLEGMKNLQVVLKGEYTVGKVISLRGCKNCIHVDVCRYRTDPGSKDCVFKHSSEDIRPVVRGRWIYKGFEKGYECSVCGSRCLLDRESDFLSLIFALIAGQT